jgi:hypothetical protein
MPRAIPPAIAAIAALAATLALPPGARAACASAVVVDGRVLFGGELPPGARLPAAAGTHRAVSPACNDTGGDEQDTTTTVTRLAGVPPRIAVTGRDRDTLFLADGTLLALATHPLHRAQFPSRREPSYREGRRCTPHRTPLDAIVLDGRGALRVRVGRRVALVNVDARTRITNRPAYQPVLPRQRLLLRTSRCGPRRVADRITFAGPPVTPEPYRAVAARDGHGPAWRAVLIVLGCSVLGLIAFLAWRLLDLSAPRDRP